MIHCKDCEHWGEGGWNENMGICDIIWCDKRPNMIHLEIDNEYDIFVKTNGDFGCVLGVQK